MSCTAEALGKMNQDEFVPWHTTGIQSEILAMYKLVEVSSVISQMSELHSRETFLK